MKQERIFLSANTTDQVSIQSNNLAQSIFAQEGPADPGHRVVSLDILRGFAVLGILLLNIYDFASPSLLFDIPVGLIKPAFTGWHSGLDNIIVWLTWFFAEGKMRSLFSILFGAGVIMLTERYENTGRSRFAASIFYRRNLWLLAIGLCHGFLLFAGDILVDYSLLAMLFLFFLRRLKARTLLITGMVIWVVLGTAGFFNSFGIAKTLRNGTELKVAEQAGSHATAAQRAMISKAAKEDRSAIEGVQEQVKAGHVNYWEGRIDRINNEIGFLLLKSSGLFVSYLGAMIFGMGLYKTGFLDNQQSPSRYLAIMTIGYVITFSITGLGLWKLQHAGYSPVTFAQWLWIPYCIQVAAGTLANLSFLLLILRIKFFKRLFFPLAAVGRMALSNYILTSIICGWVFSWGPLKLYGVLEFYQWYMIVAAIWFVNLLFSITWLKYFRFGPIEWVWRSLTYWKRQPMRI